MYDKVQRLIKHIETLNNHLQLADVDLAKRAALLSKADLASEMVYEFPELQGIVGQYYALAGKENREVAQAIDEQWMPRGENAPLPQTGIGILLSLSDKIDNLLSCYLVGLKPTSSSDPYALRRQVLGIIKMLIEKKSHVSIKDLFRECLHHFPENLQKDKEALLSEIESFFTNRIKTVFLDFGFSKEEIEASLSGGFDDVYDAFCKVKALREFRTSNDRFPLLFEVYKRAKGQIHQQKALAFSSKLLQEEAEKKLDQQLNTTQVAFEQAINQHDYQTAYQLIASLQPAIATLFDQVKILADDPAVKNNRLALLQRVFALFSRLLDFSKIQES